MRHVPSKATPTVFLAIGVLARRALDSAIRRIAKRRQ